MDAAARDWLYLGSCNRSLECTEDHYWTAVRRSKMKRDPEYRQRWRRIAEKLQSRLAIRRFDVRLAQAACGIGRTTCGVREE